MPAHPTKEGYADIDLKTTLVDTWKAMIRLPKSKVRLTVYEYRKQFN